MLSWVAMKCLRSNSRRASTTRKIMLTHYLCTTLEDWWVHYSSSYCSFLWKLLFKKPYPYCLDCDYLFWFHVGLIECILMYSISVFNMGISKYVDKNRIINVWSLNITHCFNFNILIQFKENICNVLVCCILEILSSIQYYINYTVLEGMR